MKRVLLELALWNEEKVCEIDYVILLTKRFSHLLYEGLLTSFEVVDASATGLL
jgi:hypothetical protein